MTVRQIALAVLVLAIALAALAPFREQLHVVFPWESTNTMVAPYKGGDQESLPIDRRTTAHKIAANRKRYEGVHVVLRCTVLNAPGDGTATATCGTGTEVPIPFSLRGDVDSLAADRSVVVDGIVENPLGSGAEDGPPNVSVLNVR